MGDGIASSPLLMRSRWVTGDRGREAISSFPLPAPHSGGWIEQQQQLSMDASAGIAWLYEARDEKLNRFHLRADEPWMFGIFWLVLV